MADEKKILTVGEESERAESRVLPRHRPRGDAPGVWWESPPPGSRLDGRACRNCVYFRALMALETPTGVKPLEPGACHRMPPQMGYLSYTAAPAEVQAAKPGQSKIISAIPTVRGWHVQGQLRAVYAQVNGSQWCGEFEAVTPPRDPSKTQEEEYPDLPLEQAEPEAKA